jgi:hypothetical protein
MSFRVLSYLRNAVLAVAAATLSLAGAACGANSATHDTPAPHPPDDQLGHVHGLGVNPADDALYVASHLGVYRMADGQRPVRVADRYQDTMGFTVVGPNQFLASGHPDLREDLPSSLGLIYSSDAAQRWTALALQGQADFHILEPTSDRLYAYDANSGQLLIFPNKPWENARTWQQAGQLELADLAAAPNNAHELAATTVNGQLLLSDDGGHTFTEVAEAPRLVFIDWAQAGQLVGVDSQSRIFISTRPVGPWQPTGVARGEPQALDAIPGRWHLATNHGIFVSPDDGRTWRSVQQ